LGEIIHRQGIEEETAPGRQDVAMVWDGFHLDQWLGRWINSQMKKVRSVVGTSCFSVSRQAGIRTPETASHRL